MRYEEMQESVCVCADLLLFDFLPVCLCVSKDL